MTGQNNECLVSAIFITFSGNCKRALTFYQTLFGGIVQIETFEDQLDGYTEMPVVSGSLVSDRIIIHGSDLVHNEGRKIGNYISIFLQCKNAADRNHLIEKLENKKKPSKKVDDQKLIEVTDSFDVRWTLCI